MAAKTANDKLQDLLAERFDAETEVGQRVQGGKRLDYIGIDKTIGRFNKVLGAAWSFSVQSAAVQQIEVWKVVKDSAGVVQMDSPGVPKRILNKTYLATVTGEIEALGKRAGGVGSDVAEDPDKAIKTALAEALKKASHQYGVALYLWNEDERNVVQQIRTAASTGGALAPLKIRVMQKATDAGVEQNAEKIAEHFGVTVEQLQDVAVLERILNG